MDGSPSFSQLYCSSFTSQGKTLMGTASAAISEFFFGPPSDEEPEPNGALTVVFFFFFFLIHRFHSISFTRAQGIPKYKIGFGREKDVRVWERLGEGVCLVLARRG
jgi:hypothetical protein